MESKTTETETEIEPSKDIVDTLGRGLRVIEAFDEGNPRLSSSEVAVRAGVTRTAARRYLLSLVHFGYAETDGKRFWLMPRILRLGQSYLASARLPRLVQPFLQRLSADCGETVNFSVLDGHEMVYLARSASSQRLESIGFAVGSRVPAHLLTPGIAILSTWAPAALEEWIAQHEFTRVSHNGIADADDFRRHVEGARRQGYWMTEGLLTQGLQGIAMPLKDRRGECRGAIGSTMPIQSYTRDEVVRVFLPRLSEVVALLRDLV
jgi:IclR family pca regulon transcriptional regulator